MASQGQKWLVDGPISTSFIPSSIHAVAKTFPSLPDLREMDNNRFIASFTADANSFFLYKTIVRISKCKFS